MARRITKDRVPFSYRSGTTPLHCVPAIIKLPVMLALSAFAFSSIPGLLISALLTAIASVIARIRPWELLRGSRPLMLLSLFILVYKTIDLGTPGITLGEITAGSFTIPAFTIPHINPEGFFEGILSGLRIAAAFAAGSLLFAVTSAGDLRRSLPGRRLGLAVSLMLGFISRFFELWETMNEACEARSGRRGFRRITVIIPLVCERMMEAAGEMADALEARGYQFRG